MDFDDHRAPRSDVCILLLHHNIGDELVLHSHAMQCIGVCACSDLLYAQASSSTSTSNQNVHQVCACHSCVQISSVQTTVFQCVNIYVVFGYKSAFGEL